MPPQAAGWCNGIILILKQACLPVGGFRMTVLFRISFYSSYLYIDKTRGSEYNRGKKVETYETYFLHTHTHTHTISSTK